jgi:DNA replication and repair protein RecF
MAQSRPEPNILAFPAASRVSPSGGVAEAGALQLGALLAGPYVARLMVSDFRCYERAALETDPRPVVLTGPNGAGKTNLLEALSFLAPGRGLRQARLAEVDRRRPAPPGGVPGGGVPGGAPAGEARSWAVAAKLGGPAGECDIGTGRDPAAEEGTRDRRLLRIDGTSYRGLNGLAERLAVLWLTPQMDGLFLDSKSARRRFLDRLVLCFDPGHAGRLNAYEQAASERMRLLRGEMPAGEARNQAAWLDALEQQIAEKGVAIAAARLDLTARLGAVLGATEGSFPRPGLALLGEVESWLGEMPALAAEDRMRARLAAGRTLDAEAGRAHLGPHKSDLLVSFGSGGGAVEMPAADCSTGEQKALLIAILLGQARLMAAERGRPPLLLLDEIAAHLDDGRRRALFDALLELGIQAWLTGTDRGLFAALGEQAQYFTVADARITRN